MRTYFSGGSMTRTELSEFKERCEAYGIPKKKMARGGLRLIEFLQKPGPAQKVREGIAVTLGRRSLIKCFPGKVMGRGTKHLYSKAKALLLEDGCLELVNKHCRYRAAAAEYRVQGWLQGLVLPGGHDSAGVGGHDSAEALTGPKTPIVSTVDAPTRAELSVESSIFIPPLKSKELDLSSSVVASTEESGNNPGLADARRELNSLLFKENKTDSDMARIKELSRMTKKARPPTAAVPPSTPPGCALSVHDHREREFGDRMEQALELERGAA